MKQFILKIASISMALVVLFSTMSFTINSHYCGDTLVDTSYFSKAKTCGMDLKKDFNETCSITTKKCCKDVIQVIEGADNLNVSGSYSLNLDQQLFLVTLIYRYYLIEDLQKNVNSISVYVPPLIIKDIHLLDNVFLI